MSWGETARNVRGDDAADRHHGLMRIPMLRCDACGRFVGLVDLEHGRATRRLVTPDSLCSVEEFETLCPDHAVASVRVAETLV
jgi:hypothetical protein